MLLELTVNGEACELEVQPDVTLQDVLRLREARIDVHDGCGEGVCGACTVLMDGHPTASCVLLAVQAHGSHIVTAQHLGSHEELGEAARTLEAHFADKAAFQCGYCACGIHVSATHYVASVGDPDPAAIRQALSGHLCRCTGYQQIVDAISAACRKEAAPQITRDSLLRKVRGQARYPTDPRPNTLVARILWSPWPHAKLDKIDVERARALPGVHAVLTAADIPGRNLTGSVFANDQPLLAVDRVLSRGDAVALVAATSDKQARAAVAAIRCEYTQLEAVVDAAQAAEPSAPALRRGGNVVAQVVTREGNAADALRSAAHVVEATYRCRMSDQACMEREGGVGWMDGDCVVLCVPSLAPHTMRNGVARALGIARHRVRIEAERFGGSFGKYLVPSVEDYLALLVHATGQPVRLVLDREEMLQRSTKRHAFEGRYRLGLDAKGKFVGLQAEVFADAGPYISLTPAVVSVLADEAMGPYAIPTLDIVARGVLTNNLLASPMRGFGSTQVGFGIESIVEKAARVTGIDPARLRSINYARTRTTGSGEAVDDPGLQIDQTRAAALRRLGGAPTPPDGWVVGRGIATAKGKYGYPYGLRDRAVVGLSVEPSGEIWIETTIPDTGTGLWEGLGTCVRDVLGLETRPKVRTSRAMLDDATALTLTRGRGPSALGRAVFRVLEYLQTMASGRGLLVASRLPPTRMALLLRLCAWPINLTNASVNVAKAWLFPKSLDSFVPRTSSSRGLLMAGRAARDAAEQLKSLVVTLAAQRLEEAGTELTTEAEGVRSSATGRVVSWSDLACVGPLATVGVSELPRGRVLDPKTGNQVGAVDYVYATHACYVAVDPVSGQTRVLRYVAAQDLGYVHDLEVVRGQLYGGTVMGIAQTLGEHLDARDGSIGVSGLHDYLVPTCLDAPGAIILEILESGTGLGPQGAKGVGEIGAVAAPLAIANALFDATGWQPTAIPVAPMELAERFGEREYRDG